MLPCLLLTQIYYIHLGANICTVQCVHSYFRVEIPGNNMHAETFTTFIKDLAIAFCDYATQRQHAAWSPELNVTKTGVYLMK